MSGGKFSFQPRAKVIPQLRRSGIFVASAIKKLFSSVGATSIFNAKAQSRKAAKKFFPWRLCAFASLR